MQLPGGAWDRAAVERLLAVADSFGLSPHRPDGKINGFDTAPGHEGDHHLLDRSELVHGLATGSWATNLWDRSEADVRLAATPGGATGWASVVLSLNSAHCWRTPVAEAEPFRELHRLLTDPAAVDVLEFAHLHHEYRRATATNTE